jgi:MFS family permease
MSYFAALRRFNRNVNLFLIAAAIIGFTNFGGIFAALFNIYLLRLGYDTQFIGSINAVGSVALLIACLPASMLERRLGSRKMILISLALIIFANLFLQGTVFIPEALRSIYIMAANALSFTGLATYFVSSQPFLAASTTPVERGHVFSVQAAMWPLSGFIGSLFGGIFPGFISRMTGIPITGPGPYQLTLWIGAVFSVCALLVMLPTRQPLIEEKDTAPSSKEKLQEQTPSNSLFFGLTPFQIIAVLSVVVAVQITGEGAMRSFLNVYLDDALLISTSRIGLILGFGQLIAGLGALLTPFFTARLGNAKTFILFTLGITLCMLPLIFIPTWYGAGMSYMGTIMMVQIARPALITIQMESVTPSYRAPMSAGTTMAASLSSALVSLLGGFMITTLGYPSFFLVAAWITALSAIGFWLYLRIRPRLV